MKGSLYGAVKRVEPKKGLGIRVWVKAISLERCFFTAGKAHSPTPIWHLIPPPYSASSPPSAQDYTFNSPQGCCLLSGFGNHQIFHHLSLQRQG